MGFVIFPLRIFLVLAKAVVVVVCDCGGRLRVCGEGLTAPASLPLLKARVFLYSVFGWSYLYVSVFVCLSGVSFLVFGAVVSQAQVRRVGFTVPAAIFVPLYACLFCASEETRN